LAQRVGASGKTPVAKPSRPCWRAQVHGNPVGWRPAPTSCSVAAVGRVVQLKDAMHAICTGKSHTRRPLVVVCPNLPRLLGRHAGRCCLLAIALLIRAAAAAVSSWSASTAVVGEAIDPCYFTGDATSLDDSDGVVRQALQVLRTPRCMWRDAPQAPLPPLSCARIVVLQSGSIMRRRPSGS